MDAARAEAVIQEFFERRGIAIARVNGILTIAVASTITTGQAPDQLVEQDMDCEFFAVPDLADAIARGDGS